MLRVVIGKSESQPMDSVLEGLVKGLAVEVLGVTTSGRETLDALRSDPVDIFMFPADWFDLARSVRENSVPETQTAYVVATPDDSPVHVVRAVQYGYEGVVSTGQRPGDISSHLAAIAAGKAPLSEHPLLAGLDLRPGLFTRSLVCPSALDEEVAELVACGLTDGEISHVLSVPVQTVRNRIETLLASNGLTQRTQLAILQIVTWRVPGLA